MIRRLIPGKFRRWVELRIQNMASRGKPTLTAMKYIPSSQFEDACVVPRLPDANPEMCDLGLPLPPSELRLSSNRASSEEYLKAGKQQLDVFLDMARLSGLTLGPADRVLDFGCAAGRLLIHLKPLADNCEIWGCDINADCMHWCTRHLSPPFRFFTNTTLPHMPFDDGYFDFIYCGSIFTHIDDLAQAWLLELRRILSNKGRLLITVADTSSFKLFEGAYREYRPARSVLGHELYRRSKDNFGMLSIRRQTDPLVFYDTGYLQRILAPVFDIVEVRPEVYVYQTGILLKRKLEHRTSR